MSNLLATLGIDEKQLTNVQEVQQEIAMEHGLSGANFVRLNGQTGEWVGFDEEIDPEDEEFVLLPVSIQAVVTVWEAGKMDAEPVASFHRLLFQNPKPVTDDEVMEALQSVPAYSPNKHYDFRKGYAFLMMDKGTGDEYVFAANSASAANSVRRLITQITSGQYDLANEVILFHLGKEKFKNKFGTFTWKPVFKVEGADAAENYKFTTPLQPSNI